jgi:hypothetical protein
MNLGDTLIITQVYKRRERSVPVDGKGHVYHVTRKEWIIWPIKPRGAIFLGWRTLSNGVREWEDEVGAIFIPDKDGYLKAAMVCFSTRENPVYVPVESLS